MSSSMTDRNSEFDQKYEARVRREVIKALENDKIILKNTLDSIWPTGPY